MFTNIAIKDLLILVLSICSFLISIITLYKTQFSNARIRIFAGEHLNLGHFKEGNFQVTLPVILINSGVKTGVIRRFALLIQDPNSEDGYLLEPYFYQKIDEAGTFQHESQPAPVTIAGKQNLAKLILFRSSMERPTEFQLLNTGTYIFTLLSWTNNSGNPDIADSFSVTISPETATQLYFDFKNKTGKTTQITQENWLKWRAKSLAANQIKAVLK
jgi:hypothetical protein